MQHLSETKGKVLDHWQVKLAASSMLPVPL
jgi:hypothetical protein